MAPGSRRPDPTRPTSSPGSKLASSLPPPRADENPEEAFRRALDRFRLRDYSAALEIWRGLQLAGYDHPHLELYLAVARREQARVLQLLEDYGDELGSRFRPDEVEAVEGVEGPAGRARRLLRERRYGEAVGALETAILEQGADAFALRLALAQVQLLLGHAQDALFHLELARVMREESSQLHGTFGAVFREMGRPMDAERAYRRALDLDGGDAACWFGLARLYYDDERYDLAESCLGKVLALRPGAMHATSLLDEVRRRQDQIEVLLEEAKGVVEAHPEYPDWHHRIALYYTYLGRYEEASDHLEKALGINPRMVKSAYQLGLLRARQGRWAEACEAFLRVVAERPELEGNPEVAASRELFANGAAEEAAFELSVVAVPGEDKASRLIDLGKRLYAESFLSQARRELELAIAVQPRYPDAHYVLGRVASDQDQPAEAIEHFSRALALSPRYQQAALALARVQLKQGNLLAARELAGQYRPDARGELVKAWAGLASELEAAGG